MKKRTVWVALGLSLWLAPMGALASDEPRELQRKGFGFAAGGTSGVGFAWRETCSSGWGYQVGGGVWIPSFEERRGIWSLGLQGFRVIDQTGWWRLYALAGMHQFGNIHVYETTREAPVLPKSPEPAPTPETPLPTVTAVQWDAVLNLGAGFGLEFGVSDGVSVALEVPLVVGLKLSPYFGFAHLMPIPNLSLLYNF